MAFDNYTYEQRKALLENVKIEGDSLFDPIAPDLASAALAYVATAASPVVGALSLVDPALDIVADIAGIGKTEGQKREIKKTVNNIALGAGVVTALAATTILAPAIAAGGALALTAGAVPLLMLGKTTADNLYENYSIEKKEEQYLIGLEAQLGEQKVNIWDDVTPIEESIKKDVISTAKNIENNQKSNTKSNLSNKTKKEKVVPSTVTPPINVHLDYLDKNYQGGSKAYIESQQQRWREAEIRGEREKMDALIADAKRVGYELSETDQNKLENKKQYVSTNQNLNNQDLENIVKTNEEKINNQQAFAFSSQELANLDLSNISLINQLKINGQQDYNLDSHELYNTDLNNITSNVQATKEQLDTNLENHKKYLEDLTRIKQDIVSIKPSAKQLPYLGGGSSSSGFDSSTEPVNEHKAYLDSTWEGGSETYIKGQQERFREAAKEGNTDLIGRLIADSERVGYNLYHSGGFVGGKALDPRHEEIAKLLKGELVLNSYNLNNIPKVFTKIIEFPKNIAANLSRTQPSSHVKNYHFSNITVKADDIQEFIRSMEFLVASE